jgi:hypothetical protein
MRLKPAVIVDTPITIAVEAGCPPHAIVNLGVCCDITNIQNLDPALQSTTSTLYY